MSEVLLCVWFTLLPGVEQPKTSFWQVHPLPAQARAFRRTLDRSRAVVLIGGLRLGDGNSALLPALQEWQSRGSRAVRLLGREGDVFSFGYSQASSVDAVARSVGLREGVARLRRLGYREIILVGHSAGGLIARQFVEDNPRSGVTKVIQVCTPNGGAFLARLAPAAPAPLQEFVRSLTREAREQCLHRRRGKVVPGEVDFVCVVVRGTAFRSDWVLSCRTQWSEDLEKQGIPACLLEDTSHERVMEDALPLSAIARLVREQQKRLKGHQITWLRHQVGRP